MIPVGARPVWPDMGAARFGETNVLGSDQHDLPWGAAALFQ